MTYPFNVVFMTRVKSYEALCLHAVSIAHAPQGFIPFLILF